MTVETEVAALTSAVNLLTSTVNVSKATLDASVAAAEAAYDSFDDRYLGAKVSAPSLDNDGGSLLTGALYFNSTENAMYVYTGASWVITTNYNNVTAPYTLAQTLNTNGNNVTFGDNGKAIFGAGSDLQIYHDGSNSYIADVGTGSLKIQGVNLNLQSTSGESYIDCVNDGTVYVYHNNAAKLATTATGIDVTGTATMDGLVVSGSKDSTNVTISAPMQTVGGGNLSSYNEVLFDNSQITGSSGQAYLRHYANSHNDAESALAFGVTTTGGTTHEALRIDGSGDISFYEDTGTTAKLTWDASAEMLTTSGLTVAGAMTSGDITIDADDTPSLKFEKATGSDVLASINVSTDAGTGGKLAIQTKRNGNSAVDRVVINDDGNVSFYEDTGTTAKFFWDASAQRLGIGTSSPSSTLHLKDNFSSGVAVVYDRTENAAVSNLFYTGVSSTFNSSFMWMGTAATSFVINNSGNVGIGTDSPDQELHVSASATPVIRIESRNNSLSTNESIGSLEFEKLDASGGGAGVASSINCFTTDLGGAVALSFQTGSSSGNNTERMRIDSSGNVGIGVADPAEKLQVNGNLMVGDGLTAGSFIDVVGAGASQDFGIRFGSEADRDNKASILATTTTAALRFFTNGANERMRIDSSGNVLVGKTTTGFGTAGIELHSDDQVYATSTTHPLALNRLSTDGDIAKFYKDGTTVGSIGNTLGRLFIGSGNTGIRFIGDTSEVSPWDTSTNSGRDAAISLGNSGNRFKDLYLSGGVYLGGTGAANKLDDYETGTFIPSLSFGGASVGLTYYSQLGRYTKVGRQVTVQIAFYINSKGSSTGAAVLSGLPFFVTAQAGGFSSYSNIVQAAGFSTLTGAPFASANENSSNVVLRQTTATDFAALTEANFNASCYMQITITYFTS